jgi:hypothetical protein
MNLRDLANDTAEVGRAVGALTARPGPTPTASRTPRAPGCEVVVRRTAVPGDRAGPQVEPYLFPRNGDQPFTEKVSPAAVAKVDAIREQALALGWSERGLYQNRGQFRFPYGEDYGLVCFIGDAQRIGEVTKQYIEIISPPPRENRLRFYNPDAPQPWRAACLSPSASGRGLSLVIEKSRRAPGRS